MKISFASSTGKQQRGAATVEFALLAIVFFLVLLGTMDFGRLMYVWTTTQEVTRHAAREAVVRAFTSAEIGAIQRESIFRGGSTGTAYLPAGVEITNTSVKIVYMAVDAGGNRVAISAGNMPADPADNISACADALRVTISCIKFVQACIAVADDCVTSIPYHPMVGLLAALGIDLAINIPASAVVMPAESMGFSVS